MSRNELRKNMMAKYRVVNIPKQDFDELKEYCDKNALKLSKWLVLLAKQKIESENKND